MLDLGDSDATLDSLCLGVHIDHSGLRPFRLPFPAVAPPTLAVPTFILPNPLRRSTITPYTLVLKALFQLALPCDFLPEVQSFTERPQPMNILCRK